MTYTGSVAKRCNSVGLCYRGKAVCARAVLADAALSVIDELYMSSRDIAVFWREWIAFCRDMMIAVSTKMSGVRDEALKNAAEKFTLPGILYLLEIFHSMCYNVNIIR